MTKAKKVIVVPYASVFYIPDFVIIYSWIWSNDERMNGLMHGRMVYTGKNQKNRICYACQGGPDIFSAGPRYFLDNRNRTLVFWGRFLLKEKNPADLLEWRLCYEYGAINIIRQDVRPVELLKAVKLPEGDLNFHNFIAQAITEAICRQRKLPHRQSVEFKKKTELPLLPIF